MACDAVVPPEAARAPVVLHIAPLSCVTLAAVAFAEGTMPPIEESRWNAGTTMIVFTPLTSCLTVTLVDPGNGSATGAPRLIGAHFVAGQTDHIFPILRGMKAMLQGRTPSDIYMVGVLQIWTDENFTGSLSKFTAFTLIGSISEMFSFPDDRIRVLQTDGKGEVVSFTIATNAVTLRVNGVDKTAAAQPVM
jgi:hypothetical protein